MILDADLLFSKEQAVTSSAASTALDLQAPGDAVGQELTIHTLVTTSFAGLTSLQVKLQTSKDNSAWEDVLMTPAITLASGKLKAGSDIFKVRVPGGLDRYVRLYYTVSGTASAGKVTAFMSKEF